MYELVTEKLDKLNKLNKQLRIVNEIEVGELDLSLPQTVLEIEIEIEKVKAELNYKWKNYCLLF